jgi:hypothetical protein
VLVWKQERAFFVAKGLEAPATPDQVESLRRFDRELNQSLNPGASPTPIPSAPDPRR